MLIPASARKIGNGQLLTIPALLVAADLSINCYVMCDEIGEKNQSVDICLNDQKQLELCVLHLSLQRLLQQCFHQPCVD